jgi:sterol 24-C-methyltransferase
MTPRSPNNEHLINHNPHLQSYFGSLESRIGYLVILGDTRHFGYYEKDTFWPFPIDRGLRKMEEMLLKVLNLPPGSDVLEAGCGVAHVAIYMGRHGMRISGIDVVDHHIAKAQRNIAKSGLPPGQVTVEKMDYHHLESISNASKHGVYTMETFVHATDPAQVLAGFFRILKPGGRIALFEYDHDLGSVEGSSKNIPSQLVAFMKQVNEWAAMLTNQLSHRGYFKGLHEDAGFENVEVRDCSKNNRPMLRLFYVLAIVPYYLIRLCQLEKFFVNTLAGAWGYVSHEYWRYVVITATKPGSLGEPAEIR